MTVIGLHDALIDERESAVKLARYAQLIDMPEDQFFGLNNTDTAPNQACNAIWTHAERARIAKYLKEAQEEIEQVTRYPLCPKYFVDEQHYYGFPILSDWGKVIAAGVRSLTTIQAAAAVSYATEPAVIGPFATTVTDEDEIRIYHPGTDIEICPSDVSIAGGTVTIQVPRARLVRSAYEDNPATGNAYATLPPAPTSPFETTVDIKREYTNHSTEGGLFWPHKDSTDCTCNCVTCCGTCGDYSVNACIYVRNPETGAMDLLDATYSGTSWTHSCSTCYCEDPTFVKVNYVAGLQTLTMQAEDAVIRLAHSKMPSPPCGCGTVQEMWTRDRHVPDVLDSARLQCPFGINDGAWIAWKFANAMRLQIGLAMG